MPPENDSREPPGADEERGSGPEREARADAKGPGGLKKAPRPTREEALEGLAAELADAPGEVGIDDPRLEAERLLCHVIGIDRAELASTGDRRLEPEEGRQLARVTGRRVRGEPLQHIEGTVQFRRLLLLADGRAFIPRPETEQLVDRIEAWARDRAETGGVTTVGRGRRGEPLLGAALDIGTGSGAIALSLVKERIAGRVVGLDVSPEALMQAAANRGGAELGEEEVEFRLASRPLWSSVGRDERFDLIVSNPPYVSDEEMSELPAEVRDHEPRVALAGGPEGLDVIREIVRGAASYLTPAGALFLEIGAGQGEAVRDLLEAGGAWGEVEVQKDLAGRDRFVRAEPAAAPG